VVDTVNKYRKNLLKDKIATQGYTARASDGSNQQYERGSYKQEVKISAKQVEEYQQINTECSTRLPEKKG
jgi:hypothetical protein